MYASADDQRLSARHDRLQLKLQAILASRPQLLGRSLSEQGDPYQYTLVLEQKHQARLLK